MEKIKSLSAKDIGISQKLGGADTLDYEKETENPDNNAHYSDQTGHVRRGLANKELSKKLLSIGVLAVGLITVSCMPPVDTSYYDPFSDIIHYNGTPEATTIIHEEGHQTRANTYPQGRYIWGIRYAIDKPFACTEELAVGATTDHPSCSSLKK